MGTKKKLLTCCKKHAGRREKIPCHRKMHTTIDEIETKWRPKCAIKKRDSNSGGKKSMRNSKIDDINSRRACHCCCCNRRCDSSDSSTQFNYGSKDKQSVVALLAQSIFFSSFSISWDTFHPFRPFYLFIFSLFRSFIHEPRGICSRRLKGMCFMYAHRVRCVLENDAGLCKTSWRCEMPHFLRPSASLTLPSVLYYTGQSCMFKGNPVTKTILYFRTLHNLYWSIQRSVTQTDTHKRQHHSKKCQLNIEHSN